MTAPCPPGVMNIGTCPAPLRVCYRPGALYARDVQMVDPATGDPLDWPVGMTAWLQVQTGGFNQSYPITVDGSLLRILVSGANTVNWPDHACVRIWLRYAEYPLDPIVWVEGHAEGGCC